MGTKKHSIQFEQLAFGLMALGFAAYIAADSGLLKNLHLPSFEQTLTQQEKLTNTTRELGQIEQETEAKKHELKELLSQIEKIQQDVKSQKHRLANLKDNFKSPSPKRLPSAKGRPVKNTPSTTVAASSWDDFIEQIRSTGGETEIQTFEKNGLHYIRLTNERLFGRDSFYLRPVGINMAKMLAASFRSLGGTRIFIQADGDDKMIGPRTHVLKDYLEQLTEQDPNIEIGPVAIAPLLEKSRQGIEIWVQLGEKGT